MLVRVHGGMAGRGAQPGTVWHILAQSGTVLICVSNASATNECKGQPTTCFAMCNAARTKFHSMQSTYRSTAARGGASMKSKPNTSWMPHALSCSTTLDRLERSSSGGVEAESLR